MIATSRVRDDMVDVMASGVEGYSLKIALDDCSSEMCRDDATSGWRFHKNKSSGYA